jgi:hypothetical protein
MKRRTLWLAAVLGAGMLALAWAGSPGGTRSGQDGAAQAQAHTQTQVQSQVQSQVQTQSQEQAQAKATDCSCEGPDRLRPRDGSCQDATAAIETLTADLLQDRIRDRLQDGSCLVDGSCQDYDYDYGFDYDFNHGYDYDHDGPAPDGGFGAGPS